MDLLSLSSHPHQRSNGRGRLLNRNFSWIMTSISYCTSFCEWWTQHSPFPSPIEFAVFRITTGKQSRDDPLAKGFRSFTTFPSHRWFPMDRTGFPFQSHNRPQPTFTHSNSPKSIPGSPEPFALCRFPCNSITTHYPSGHQRTTTFSFPVSLDRIGMQIMVHSEGYTRTKTPFVFTFLWWRNPWSRLWKPIV